MVFCLACGLVAPDAAKFCPACGAEIQITKPESSNGENLIHEALGNVADSPRPRSKAPLIWGVGTFLVLIVLIIAVLSGGGSNTDTTGGGSNTDTTGGGSNTDTTSSNGSQYLTSQDQSILSAPAGEFINTSGLTLLEAGLGNIRIDESGDLKSFVDALYVAEIRGIGSTGPITASDYQYSLQPGYGLYTMVHNVFVGYGLIAVPDELVSLAAADEAAGKNYEDYR